MDQSANSFRTRSASWTATNACCFNRAIVAGLIFGLLTLSASEASAQRSVSSSVARKIDAAVNAEMQRQAAVSVAVGIIKNGRVVFTRAYGLADRESGTRATTRTVYNWASNSKPLIAVVAFKLVEQGKLDLDADVRRYVPEFPAKSGVITCRHILCHQSGIPHYSNGVVRGSLSRTSKAFEPSDPADCVQLFD